ncbi:MAG: hypothetical protein A2W91_02725 [Bacteroidetes bacterium GWF2_38_335]|nr:MAG: hypothetical protein A2W91_02725 [Bacteroidetes bacterium GWF2_38_335]OFY77591.1 MAG: hypothetical protein A2281_02035 [Bacteroidetes bacterium RIFOXYA12_FULL_38_20]HBS87107.1 hypothetical protein [Bacteroidales bacterium]
MPASVLAPSFLPEAAVLEMTYRCNHQCLFCSCPWEAPSSNYIRSEELDTDEWKNCIEKLCEMGVNSFSFTGGEPLLKKDFKEILKFASSQKCLFHDKNLNKSYRAPDLFLISNGQLVDEEILSLLKELNVSLSMSLPGLKTYNRHTQSGSPEKILQLFSKAHAMGIKTTVNISVTRINLHELFETISNAMIAGADNLLLNRFLPGGRGLEYLSELMLNEKEIIEALETAENVLVKANRKGSVGTELPRCIIFGKKFVNLRVGTMCSAAREFFVVGPEGNIRTCNHSPRQLNHISDIENLKHNDYWKHFVFKEYHPEMCKECGLLFNCDGGCREAAHVYRGKLICNDPVFEAGRKTPVDFKKNQPLTN